jgi:chromate transporter
VNCYHVPMGDVCSNLFETDYMTRHSGQPTTSKHLFLSFLKLGLTAFGGPAMIAHIKELSVERKRWLDEDTYNDGIVLCQSIPGATAMQMAAYVGLKSQGIVGALASYIGFGLPAFVLMLALSTLYADAHKLSMVISLFNGLQVIVVALVANATYTFGKSVHKGYLPSFIAAASAILFWKGVNPFFVIIGAGMAGALLFANPGNDLVPLPPLKVNKKTYGPVVILSSIMVGGLIALFIADKELFHLAALMLRIDLFAIGGGFASVPLMLHEIVDVRSWIDSKTFMDGIALGQVTPGPIVITSTFVGYIFYGFAGSVVATIAIFTPSFLILTAIAPIFERLKYSRYFISISKGIFSSFVGLLLFATIKFAINVQWDTLRALLGLAALAALVYKIDILYIVLIGAVISLVLL